MNQLAIKELMKSKEEERISTSKISDIDTTANIAIASRKDAMGLRAELELSKLKVNDTIAVGVIHRFQCCFY